MLRFFILILFVIPLFGQSGIPKRCSSSVNCKSCHGHQVKDWSKSWHARSHYEKNEYFHNMIDYISKKSYKSKDRIKVACARCHNPRIGIKKVDKYEDIGHAFDLENKNSELAKAIDSEILKEGINCIVCHKIASIENSQDKSKRGNDILTWLKPGTIGGPFNDAKSSFHKTKQQKFFNNPDKLCLVCHENIINKNGLFVANTGEEFRSVKKAKKKCVDCHMGEKENGFAAMVKNSDGVKMPRMVRRHRFIGAHSKKIIRQALDISLKATSAQIKVRIDNPNPHNIPTGFGGREIIVRAVFDYGHGQKEQAEKHFTSEYYGKKDRPTVPFLAKKQKTFSIPAYGHMNVTFKRPKGVKEVTVTLSFRLVNDTLVTMLKLKDKLWSQEEIIQQRSLLF